MIIPTPHIRDLSIAPELAILAALEAALAITIPAIAAANPELDARMTGNADFAIEIETAAALARQAAELIDTINRYRLAIVDPQAWDF